MQVHAGLGVYLSLSLSSKGETIWPNSDRTFIHAELQCPFTWADIPHSAETHACDVIYFVLCQVQIEAHKEQSMENVYSSCCCKTDSRSSQGWTGDDKVSYCWQTDPSHWSPEEYLHTKTNQKGHEWTCLQLRETVESFLWEQIIIPTERFTAKQCITVLL